MNNKKLKDLISIPYGVLRKFIPQKKLIHAPILYYHSVGDTKNTTGLRIETKEFEQQMEYCAEMFEVVSLDHLVTHLASPKKCTLQKPLLSITFDDGYLDNFEIAYPILKRNKLPATIFVATGFINNEVSFSEGGEDLKPMTWEMLQTMEKNGVSIECHTHTHPCLTHVSKQKVREEIRRSRHIIECNLKKKVNHFAYPNGAISKDSLKILQELGFKSACSTIMSTDASYSQIFKLPRIMVEDCDDLVRFKKKLSGNYNFVSYIHNRSLQV